MIRWQRFPAFLVVIFGIYQTTRASAYQAIVLDADERVIIQVDIDSGSQMFLPEIPLNVGTPVFAANPDGSIFVTGQGGFAPPTDFARFSPTSGQWELGSVETTFQFPSDMDIARDGDFVIVDEFTLKRIDRETGAVDQPLNFSLGSEPEFRAVEIDSKGAIISDFLLERETPSSVRTTTLARQRPGAAQPERIDTNLLLLDYVLESDNVLIGIGGAVDVFTGAVGERSLFRIELPTGESDVVFQNDILSRIGKLAIDPVGRILGLRNAFQGEPEMAQLVRIDLASGNMDIVDLGQRAVSDLDILIPEPSALTLLVAGCAGLALMVAGSRHRTTFSQRAKI